MRETIPLSQRPLDYLILGFFWLNILVITYIVDIEQLIISDPWHYINNPDTADYPIWPPKFMVQLTHWWGQTYDPLLLERPHWWKATIWIDQLFFGPFYAFAIYAYTKGKEWIRIPSVMWASVMMTNVIIILSEEIFGPHAAGGGLGMVLFANAAWLLMPVVVLCRVGFRERLFTREAST